MNEIRDPIYGFIKPADKELQIIDTLPLQRLRRIKQLALANLVYPGATHTRFDHSLGVYHVASLISEQLLPGSEYQEQRNTIRYAALLHDVGHGPFSHVSETVLKKFFRCNNTEEVHEQITIKLIEEDKELHKILSPNEIEKVIGLLRGKNVDYSIMKEIISGPLDADKMDYLLRDSHYCGVKYGVFDLERLINTLESYPDGEDKHISVNYDGINSLEQFVLAKYYMTRQVYRHKVRILSDSMIVRGIELGIEYDEIPFLKKLFSYSNDGEYLENYLKYFDDKLFNDILFSDMKGKAYEIFNRLYQRKLFKRIFSEKLKEIRINPVIRDKLINIDKDDKLRKRIEQNIAELDKLKIDAGYVIANSFKFKSVKEMSRNNNEGDLIIKTRNGKTVNFQNESDIFRSINKSLNDVYFEVYAPVEFDSVVKKEKILNYLKKEIITILKTLEEKHGSTTFNPDDNGRMR